MNTRKVICVGLDVENLAIATELAEQLRPHAQFFKIGLELISAEGGPQCVAALREFDVDVFYDGKFNDTPNTIAKATRAISRYGVSLLTVHASSGIDGLRAAVENRGKSKILAATVLTSMDNTQCLWIFGKESPQKVLQFAYAAREAGANGLVCSVTEAQMIRTYAEFDDFFLATPGIRPPWYQDKNDDQARTRSPFEAIRSGSDLLVIGRPIINPPQEIGTPTAAAKLIAAEIESAATPNLF